MSVHELTRSLETFKKDVGGEVTATMMLTFLFIAVMGKCSQRDVEEKLKLTTSSASRNVSFWTDRRFDRQPGMNFVERVVDPHDQRLRELTLTARGKAFYKKVLEGVRS